MSWPASTTIWGIARLKKVQSDIVSLARTIARYEPITMIADGPTHAADARGRIGDTAFPVTVLSIPTDDMWMRDIGPVFRRDGRGGLDCIGLNFNGWGQKRIHAKDALVAERVAAFMNIPITRATLVGEGGGVIDDGDGTLIATESCWVNRNRNPGRTRVQIEAELLKLYGACKMIWCTGLKGCDITDDHIDATAQFVAPGKLVVHNPPADADDEWACDARQIQAVLASATDARGRRFEIMLLNQPVHPRSTHPELLPSYINYLVVNGALINVNFGDPTTDSDTYAKLTALYPGRTIEMINLDHLYAGGGGIHCVTQQQPMA
jgi:agmatine deiminase